MTFNLKTPYLRGSETSQAAAEALDESGRGADQVKTVFEYLTAKPLTGATCDEITAHMQENGYPKIYNGSVAAALAKLEKSGKVMKTGLKRKTRSRRDAVVYIAAMHKGHYSPQQLNIKGKQRNLRAVNDRYKRAIENAIAHFEMAGYGDEHLQAIDILKKAVDN